MHRRAFAAALAVLAASLLLASTPRAGEFDPLLSTLKKVSREGANNPEAARAWKALVARGPDALLPVLAALHDDEPTAGNWLRTAADAIAEKALADGKLSAAALEKFLADTRHAGSARRIAYEWLVKADSTAPDRLLPGMLHDPSFELRYDAVERVLRQAEAELAKKDEKAARSSFRKALSGATAPEQVDAIAKGLEKLGEKIDVQKHFGVVARWHLVAPFDHHDGKGWDVAYPPEKGIDLAAIYTARDGVAATFTRAAGKDGTAPREIVAARWVEHTTSDPHGIVDLNKILGKFKGAVAYAAAFVDSPAERTVELRAGCINGLKVFLNGKEVFAREEYHHGMSMDQYSARATLKKGRNVILLKVCQNEQEENWAQEWRFQLRLCDAVGAAVPFTCVKAPTKEEK